MLNADLNLRFLLVPWATYIFRS